MNDTSHIFALCLRANEAVALVSLVWPWTCSCNYCCHKLLTRWIKHIWIYLTVYNVYWHWGEERGSKSIVYNSQVWFMGQGKTTYSSEKVVATIRALQHIFVTFRVEYWRLCSHHHCQSCQMTSEGACLLKAVTTWLHCAKASLQANRAVTWETVTVVFHIEPDN